MIPFRLYVVLENEVAGEAAKDKLHAIAHEARERAAFYFRDDPKIHDTKNRIEEELLACGSPILLRRGPGLGTPRDRVGIHLKAKEIVTARDARALAKGLFAASVHSLDEALSARDAGCDFVVFGHVFETPSKEGTPARGLDALREVCREVAPLPVFAIGGVTPERVADCRRAGAHGVAVIRALLEPKDPRPALRAFLDALYG